MSSSVDTVIRQAENLAKTQATRAVAEVRRETSIVGLAAAGLGRAAASVDAEPKTRRSGVYTRDPRADVTQYMSEGTPYATRRSVPDIRVGKPRTGRAAARLTPVQELRVAPDYKKRLIRKTVGYILLGLAAAGAAVLLILYL